MERLKNFLPQNVKHKQYLFAGSILAGLIALSAIGVAMSTPAKTDGVNTSNIDAGVHKIQIAKLASGVKAEDRLIHQYESKIKDVDKQLGEYKEGNEGLKQELEDLKSEVKKRSENDEPGVIDSLAAEIGKLREELEEMRNSPSLHSVQQVPAGANNFGNSPYIDGRSDTNNKKIVDYNVGIDSEFGQRKLVTHNLESYVPAGSFAPAVIISGVDASVAVSAQSEPRPVLFRINGYAKTAAQDGDVQSVDLEGCTVTGAASGDLSSERVFVRLLKMTCSRHDNRVFETDVQGYVAGVGKAGVRGDVISREGDFVFQSFLAGIASSAGSGVTQRFGTPVGIVGGFAAQQPTTSDVVSSSVGNGMTNATNRLSDYLIKRAEQYQPVISIPSGIEVELVFNEGFYVDGTQGATAHVAETQGGLE